MDFKHYKPGDPEFDEIAKQITPIELVRKEVSHCNSHGITATRGFKKRARKDVDKL